MNKEDYVSIELAKMLKDKGFDEPCNKWYGRNGSIFNDAHKSNHNNSIPNDSRISMPSLYEAQKWLMEKHNFYIEICKLNGEWIADIFDLSLDTYLDNYSNGNNSYQEALNNGILEALKLI